MLIIIVVISIMQIMIHNYITVITIVVMILIIVITLLISIMHNYRTHELTYINTTANSEPANTAKHSPKSISEGGRIWQVCSIF